MNIPFRAASGTRLLRSCLFGTTPTVPGLLLLLSTNWIVMRHSYLGRYIVCLGLEEHL
jgi:hypothetical protein